VIVNPMLTADTKTKFIMFFYLGGHGHFWRPRHPSEQQLCRSEPTAISAEYAAKAGQSQASRGLAAAEKTIDMTTFIIQASVIDLFCGPAGAWLTGAHELRTDGAHVYRAPRAHEAGDMSGGSGGRGDLSKEETT
jgi:hypothetical protein